MSLPARLAFALLVGLTFFAFFAAQRLKSSPPVVDKARVMKFFSPNGDGRRDVETVSFRLPKADEVTVDVVDGDGDRVRRLATGRSLAPYKRLELSWDGRSDAGTRAPDGRYRLRIGLRRSGRSVVVPAPIELDTTPPRPVVVRARVPGGAAASRGPAIVLPGQPVDVTVRGVSRYRRTQFAVLRTDAGRPRVVARFEGSRKGSRRGTWDGLVDGAPAPVGTYLIAPTVEDRAGNRGTTPTPTAIEDADVPGRPGVTVRRLAIQPPLGPKREGERATFLVDSRGRSYRWSVRRVGAPQPIKRGSASPGRPLRINAPRGRSGVYLLQVRDGAATTQVPFLVQSRRRAPLLVVLPAISWLGHDAVDGDGDGLPETLTRPTPVAYPRPLVGTQGAGLPADFAEGSAPLLAFLDRARIRYDVTTDLALSTTDTRGPSSTDRPGVLLAGSLRWIPAALGERLRRYVQGGGRLASFGADSLRRGVRIADGRLSSPTPAADEDALGARLRALRRVPSDTALVPLADDPALGLLEGLSDGISGFAAVEESVPSSAGALRLRAGLGEELGADAPTDASTGAPREPLPALAGSRLGRGVVVRIGLPEWGQRLREDGAVQQVTRNVADILRRVRPRSRSAL